LSFAVLKPFTLLGQTRSRILSSIVNRLSVIIFAAVLLAGCTSTPQTQPVAGCPVALHYESHGLPGFNNTTFDIEDYWVIKRLNRSWRERDAVIQARRKPTSEEWERFRQTLQDLRVWEWKASYSAQDLGHVITDGHAWAFSCRIGEQEIHSQGGNAYASRSEPQNTTLERSSFRSLTEELEWLTKPEHGTR